MIEQLEKEIVENGTITIDSIFRFSENPQDLPAFLGMCEKRNCTVKFALENLVCEPNKEVFMQEDNQEIWSALFVTTFIGYMTFYNKFAEKHFEYLTNFASKKEKWVQGEHEPILVDEGI